MNKFLWSLFGIGDEEVADLSRRGFLRGLGAAAVLTATGPKLFLPPIGGWRPEVVGWGNITAVTNDYIVPMLTDNLFKPSPLFTKILVKSPTRMRG
jgi:hypothetical protein